MAAKTPLRVDSILRALRTEEKTASGIIADCGGEVTYPDIEALRGSGFIAARVLIRESGRSWVYGLTEKGKSTLAPRDEPDVTGLRQRLLDVLREGDESAEALCRAVRQSPRTVESLLRALVAEGRVSVWLGMTREGAAQDWYGITPAGRESLGSGA